MPQLAQFNYAVMRAPLTDPIMAGFVERNDLVNAAADAAPGFVWRLGSEEGEREALRVFRDPLVSINLSVWMSLDALFEFTYYHPVHREAFQRRREWFVKPTRPVLVMWWQPDGVIPTVDEAKGRLDHLEAHGGTPHAFTFKNVHIRRREAFFQKDR